MPKMKYPKLRDWTKWSDEALQELDDYLSGVIIQAKRGQAQAKAALRFGDEDWLVEQEVHWRKVAQAITWLRGSMRRQLAAKKERESRGTADTGRSAGSVRG